MSNKFFYLLVAGFTVGILTSSFYKLGFSFFLFTLILAGIIFGFAKFFVKDKGPIFLIALFIFSFGLGILRYEIKEVRTDSDDLKNLIGEKVRLNGIITAEPSLKDKTAQLIITTEADQKILVSVGLFPEFKYGDQISAQGKLERPENFMTENGQIFDYVNYLAKDDIFYQISFAQVELISQGHGSWLKGKLFDFKRAFLGKLNSLIKEPESSLLGGLLLGAKNSLGQELQADFRVAGVSHIVALSGYNITIVAVGIMTVLSFLPRATALSFGALGILFFALMTGGGATVMRASIMALLVLLAKFTNRKYDISRALLLAGVFMLIENPKILVFDISFQLSFLATVALIFVSPLIEPKMTFITEKYKLRELAVSTVATQIFVLPFLIYKMGLVSIFGLLSNLFILPFIPTIMLFGFLAGLLAFVSVTLAWPLAWISSWLLTYTLGVIQLFSHLPFSALTFKRFPLALIILIYLWYFWLILRAKQYKKLYEPF